LENSKQTFLFARYYIPGGWAINNWAMGINLAAGTFLTALNHKFIKLLKITGGRNKTSALVDFLTNQIFDICTVEQDNPIRVLFDG
jgi:hypothetical protein